MSLRVLPRGYEAANLRAHRLVLLALVALTCLGLALRIWLAYDANDRLPDAPSRLAGDEIGYDGLAYGLLQGHFFEWPGRTPVYPLFLAACYLMLGHSYAVVLYVQGVISAAAIPATFALARYFLDERASLLAAALIAFHVQMAYWVTRLYSEVLYTLLFLLLLWSLLAAVRAPGLGRFILAGVLLGVATLCRPATALFPLILPVLLPRTWTVRGRLRTGLVVVGVGLVVIAPWTYHNYREYYTFLPLSASAAILWQGSPEYYHLMEAKKPFLRIWDEELNPISNGGHDPFSIEGDRYFTSRALASIRSEPLVYLRYCLEKAAYFWIGHPAVDWADYAPLRFDPIYPHVPRLQFAGLVAERLLPFAALVGLVVLRGRRSSFAPLFALCVVFMLIHALTFAEVRYSHPLHPVLAIVIAAAAASLAALPFRLTPAVAVRRANPS